MAKIRIDKDVPVPHRRSLKYPWQVMEIGDSFAFPSKDKGSVNSAACSYARRHDAMFMMRKVSETHHRIWRITKENDDE